MTHFTHVLVPPFIWYKSAFKSQSLLWHHLVQVISWFSVSTFESYHFLHLNTVRPHSLFPASQAISAPSSNVATLAKQYSLPGSSSYNHVSQLRKMSPLSKHIRPHTPRPSSRSPPPTTDTRRLPPPCLSPGSPSACSWWWFQWCWWWTTKTSQQQIRGEWKKRYFLGFFPKMGGGGSPHLPKLL